MRDGQDCNGQTTVSVCVLGKCEMYSNYLKTTISHFWVSARHAAKIPILCDQKVVFQYGDQAGRSWGLGGFGGLGFWTYENVFPKRRGVLRENNKCQTTIKHGCWSRVT